MGYGSQCWNWEFLCEKVFSAILKQTKTGKKRMHNNQKVSL